MAIGKAVCKVEPIVEAAGEALGKTENEALGVAFGAVVGGSVAANGVSCRRRAPYVQAAGAL